MSEDVKLSKEEEMKFFNDLIREEYSICNRNIKTWKGAENETIDLLFTENSNKSMTNLLARKDYLLSVIEILKGVRGRQKYRFKEVREREDEGREYYIIRFAALVEEINRQTKRLGYIHSPLFLADKDKLIKIYNKWNNVIFKCSSEDDFVSMFDINNQLIDASFEVKPKMKEYLYHLLHAIWDSGNPKAKSKFENLKELFARDFLPRFGLKANSFHKGPNQFKDEKFKSEVAKLLS